MKNLALFAALAILAAVLVSHRPCASQPADPTAGDGLAARAAAGEAGAQYTLGEELLDRKPREALDWLIKAAEQGHVKASLELGRIYFAGTAEIPRDWPESTKWYRRAAEQGNALGQFNLAVAYANGEGIPSDSREAARWYQKAAEQGNTKAQFNLGAAYSSGEGVPRDLSLALDWFRKAAGHGEARAQYVLGLMYRKGEGLPGPDLRQATDWFRKAAEQGDAPARFALASCYQRGEGVAANAALALEWFSKAAESSLEDGRFEDAFAALEKMKDIDPDHPLSRELAERLEAEGASGSPAYPEGGEEALSTGTGWLAPGGYVVTCQHLLQGARSVFLLRDGERVPARIVLQDPGNDIAILSPAEPLGGQGAIPLASSPAGMGARVFTIGFPHPGLMGVEPKLSTGEISAVSGYGDDPRFYQISVPVQSGNSGGPLLNMNGEAVGVVTAKLDALDTMLATGDLPQNVNYAIKISFVRELLGRLEPLASAPALPSAPSSLEELSRRLVGSVVMIVTE